MVTLKEKKACITKILERYGKEFADLIAELEGIDNTTDFNTFFEKLGSLLASKNIMRELLLCQNKQNTDTLLKENINEQPKTKMNIDIEEARFLELINSNTGNTLNAIEALNEIIEQASNVNNNVYITSNNIRIQRLTYGFIRTDLK